MKTTDARLFSSPRTAGTSRGTARLSRPTPYETGGRISSAVWIARKVKPLNFRPPKYQTGSSSCRYIGGDFVPRCSFSKGHTRALIAEALVASRSKLKGPTSRLWDLCYHVQVWGYLPLTVRTYLVPTLLRAFVDVPIHAFSGATYYASSIPHEGTRVNYRPPFFLHAVVAARI